MANKKLKKNSNTKKLNGNSSQKTKTESKKLKTPSLSSVVENNKKPQQSKPNLSSSQDKNLSSKNKTSKNDINTKMALSTPNPTSKLIKTKTNNVNAISYAETVGYDHCINNVKYTITKKVEKPNFTNNQRKNKMNEHFSFEKNLKMAKEKEMTTTAATTTTTTTNLTCDKCLLPAGDTSLFNMTGSSLYYKRISNINNNNNKTNNRRNNTNLRFHSRKFDNGISDRKYVAKHNGFVPITPPSKPILSSSNIAAVIADIDKMIIIENLGKGKHLYPIMQCGTLEAVPDSTYHIQRSNKMDVFQIDDGFHSDGGTETPPPSPSSASSIASTSDHGSLESVDTGGAQRLAVLSFEQVRKLHDVMDETVAIHGRGNFPTLEVKLKDLVNLVRRKLEADVVSGGAGVIVKDIRLNGGAASHVLASENQPYNDLDLIYAIEFSSSRHFDRVKSAVLNTLLDLLPEGVSKRRIMPCALKEAYVGKMVKVNNNNDGDRWSLISLGNSPGHKNVELKFVDTMRRQFEFSVDSFQIVLDSLLLFYDCAALPISENFYPTVVGESVYGDFQEALYHLQKKLISTRQPEEIRGGGLLKYCNLLVRNYKPVDSQRIKTLERYMCSRFFIDFPDINTQTIKLEAYLRNHFWGIDEEPLQYQYLMHLREVVETSTVCLMGHERRQTLLLIQSLAMQVLCHEQHKNHHVQVANEQYHHLQQQQQQQQHQHQQQQIDMQQIVHQQQHQHQHHHISTSSGSQDTQQQHQQTTSVAVASAHQQQQQQQPTTISQTIQIQAGPPPGLIYANGVYYAPVIPATICTCNSTWLST